VLDSREKEKLRVSEKYCMYHLIFSFLLLLLLLLLLLYLGSGWLGIRNFLNLDSEFLPDPGQKSISNTNPELRPVGSQPGGLGRLENLRLGQNQAVFAQP
jgi:hypothetical protein